MHDCKACGDTHYWHNECSATGLLQKKLESLQKELFECRRTMLLLEDRLTAYGVEPHLTFRVVEEARKLCAAFQNEGRGNSLDLESAVHEYNNYLAEKTKSRSSRDK